MFVCGFVATPLILFGSAFIVSSPSLFSTLCLLSFCLPVQFGPRQKNLFLTWRHQSRAAVWLIGRAKKPGKAVRRTESQRSNLSRRSPRAMLREEDGPHLLALALKFPLIHRKQSEENKRTIVWFKQKLWRWSCFVFYISQKNNEDKTVLVIPNSGRSLARSGLFCTDKSSTSDVFVFKLAAVTNSISRGGGEWWGGKESWCNA